MIEDRPFRAPYHNVTKSSFFGGGMFPRPGEITLAGKGVLFLDEMTEFKPEILEGLRANFTGECTEVGMYLAMSRQADREGYPEVAEAFKRYAWEEAEHAAKFAEVLGDCVWDKKNKLE